MTLCNNCHASIPLDSDFCPECGIKIDRDVAYEPQPLNHNQFTSFIAPFLFKIDYGNFLLKPIQWLFIAQGIGSLLIAFWTIYLLKKHKSLPMPLLLH